MFRDCSSVDLNVAYCRKKNDGGKQQDGKERVIKEKLTAGSPGVLERLLTAVSSRETEVFWINNTVKYREASER